ncbi:zinc finger SWIM domain-containing protein 3-like [Maniola jurtina]|uniref:zinc finger SWIM domain-containing protein 3-like n=1 Tax=Maniola jurtina TaxID=191418 RepID=UPI001E689EA0|nr:zinc finger SWIM domain-containing protein 3-like [Maniola jurtina]
MSESYPEFSSLEHLEQYIKNYETEHCVQLWKRDSRTLEKMKAVCPLKLKTYNPELKYYSIVYACKKGGRAFKSESSGLRKTSTYKDNCPMYIKLILNNDGTKLKIVHMVESHNHPLDRGLFKNIPKQRKLKLEAKIEATEMSYKTCNQKPVQVEDLKTTQSSTHRPNSVDTKRKYSQSDIENVINLLMQDDGAAHVAMNENGDLLGIFHQTPYMKNCFAAYPEIMVLDSTHKLNSSSMPLYNLISINGNNEAEVIAVFILSEDTTDVFRHMVRLFKELNPEWIKINTFMTDKDFEKKIVFYNEFSEASHLICLYHVFTHFRTAVTVESMQLKPLQRKNVLEILHNIAFSKSETQYDEWYERLISLNIPNVIQYYDDNWHCIKHEWVECFMSKHTTFNIEAINHLRSLNLKIKHVCQKFSDLESFFANFALILDRVKLKRQQTVHDMVLKKQVSFHETDSPANLYLNLMTPFAFSLISECLEKVDEFDVTTDDFTQFQVCEKEDCENLHTVEIQQHSAKCCCSLNVATTLPCPHIFAAMSILNMNLFDKNLIPDRFLKSKYVECYSNTDIHQDVEIKSEQGSQSGIKIRKATKRTLNTEQKYTIAMSKCEKIASIISKFNMNDFKTHCNHLDNIINLWRRRKQIAITRNRAKCICRRANSSKIVMNRKHNMQM